MNSFDNQLKVLAKGAGIVFFGILISKVISYLYRLVVARIGTSEYGVIAIGLVLFELAVMLSLIGLDQGLLRFIPQYLSQGDKPRAKGAILFALVFSATLGAVVGILLYAFSTSIAVGIFHDERLSIVLKLLAFAIPFGAIRSVLANISRAFKHIGYDVCMRYILENVLKLIFVVVLIYLGLSYMGAVAAHVIAVVIASLLFLYAVMTQQRFGLGNVHALRYPVKPLLRYSVPLLLNVIVVLFIAWTDTLMLGIFYSTHEAGIYNAASPTAQLMYMFPAMLLALFLPILTEVNAHRENPMFAHLYCTATKWVFIVNFGLLAAMMVFSDRILRTLFGDAYVAGAIPLSILLVGYFTYHLSLTGNNVLLVMKKTKLLFAVSLAGLIINVFLNLLLIPRYGIVGAATATSVAFTVMGAAIFIFAHKFVQVWPFTWRFARVVLAAVISASAAMFIADLLQMLPNVISLVLTALMYVLIYSAVLLITCSFDREDFLVLGWIEQKVGLRIKLLHRIIGRFTR